MSYIIRCTGLAGTAREPGRVVLVKPLGQYLKTYAPEAYGGQGSATWTTDLDEAMSFADQPSAWDLWRTIPANRPRRVDGEPNRPLTVYHVEVVPKATEPGGVFRPAVKRR